MMRYLQQKKKNSISRNNFLLKKTQKTNTLYLGHFLVDSSQTSSLEQLLLQKGFILTFSSLVHINAVIIRLDITIVKYCCRCHQSIYILPLSSVLNVVIISPFRYYCRHKIIQVHRFIVIVIVTRPPRYILPSSLSPFHLYIYCRRHHHQSIYIYTAVVTVTSPFRYIRRHCHQSIQVHRFIVIVTRPLRYILPSSSSPFHLYIYVVIVTVTSQVHRFIRYCHRRRHHLDTAVVHLDTAIVIFTIQTLPLSIYILQSSVHLDTVVIISPFRQYCHHNHIDAIIVTISTLTLPANNFGCHNIATIIANK